jgi:EmrB/QacA subfamily drug resistance transporter
MLPNRKSNMRRSRPITSLATPALNHGPAVPPPAPAPPAVAARPKQVLFVLLLAGVSFALSQTLVIPALPEIGHDLHASTTATSWLLTAFLLSASIATPIVGKLGDLYGKGRVLTAVLLVFAAGAVVAALGRSIGVVIAGRVLQGVAGGVFPLAFGIVRDTFPRERVPSGLGMISAIIGIGAGIGLPLSGVIVDVLDTRWLFWGVTLLALPAALAAYTLIPPLPTGRSQRIDWLGAALLSVALGAVLLGVSEADELGWGSPANVALIAGGVLVAGLFLRVEARAAEPLIDLDVLRQRSVATTNLTAFAVGLAMFASFLLIPRFAQAPESTGYGFGASVTVAGLLFLPFALAQLPTGALAGRLGTRIGFRAVLATGAALVSASFVVLAAAHESEIEVLAAGALLGAGISFAFAAMANLIVAVVPQSEVGIATGINTVMRTVGGSFGAAIATAILAGSTTAGGLPTEGAYTAAFAFSAVAGLAALLVPGPSAQPSAQPSGGEAVPSPSQRPNQRKARHDHIRSGHPTHR